MARRASRGGGGATAVMRSAGEIGAGLAPIRTARPIAPGERIHVVGVAGAGASAAAILAAGAGAIVSGCDAGGDSPYSLAVRAAGVPIEDRHDPRHVTGIPRPDRLAVTKALTAIAPDHPELMAARAAGIPVEPWQQVVADAAVGRRLAAVAGTHGKSTTSAWLVHVLVAAGRDPAAFVGALLPATITGGPPSTARLGGGKAFIVEADEYAGNFDPYRPEVIVLTSAEWDHPDVFADRAAVVAAFAAWIRRAPPGATLVANVGDTGVADVVARLDGWDGRIVSTALEGADGGASGETRDGAAHDGRAATSATHDEPAAIRGRVGRADAQGTWLEIDGLDRTPVVVMLPTAGLHNAANALGVAGAARALGLDAGAIGRGLATFPGVGRRLERRGEAGGVAVYDDYGHHPTAIRATIAALRQREPGRRVWAVYEPLTFHRTAVFLDDFANALAVADGVVIADVWPGRDLDETIVSAADLARAVGERRPGIPVAAPGTVEATADWLARTVARGDAVLVMGGGRSYRIGERLLATLEARPAD